MPNSKPAILWFRRDLRLHDNPSLIAAADRGGPLIPCFLFDPDRPEWAELGGAAAWWLHHSLSALSESLRMQGLELLLRSGPTADLLRDICQASGAARIFCNQVPEPQSIAADRSLQRSLAEDGIDLVIAGPPLLFDPPKPLNRSGEPYQVFTPYWRACLGEQEPPAPRPQPPMPPAAAGPAEAGSAEAGSGDGDPLASEDLADWRLTPTAPDWAGGLCAAWTPGEAGAGARLDGFLDAAAASYHRARDLPDRVGTSRLSPHLHWGEISPQTVWHAVRRTVAAGGMPEKAAEKYLAELGWREFSHYLLHHFPSLPRQNLNGRFDAFPWSAPDGDAATRNALQAWCRGRTGYPIVDAGMRELWTTGWMHNRVRMVVASFLVKDLRIHWRTGAGWFLDTLVDADLANNSASWQWVAGCGADAAPFFRIFNPVLQGRKFDPEGGYVREWVPEIAALPDRFLHAPWEAPAEVLRSAGIDLGETYPRPVVDHAEARRHALSAFETIKDAAE
ncbi:cryptochrome/photolyase family protein [Marinibaculum pumilum]|uniref:Cryptochrome/photolyase family protein n=1 Tax=Marinibaculum pumilum TaxID=1766165 RepID=A0ABV7KWE9_9PROT